MSIPNDPTISRNLPWWRVNGHVYSNLSMMARDVLAVPASGSSVEHLFSTAGRNATWQCARLRDSMLRNIVIYKTVLKIPSLSTDDDDAEDLPVPEKAVNIPPEWENDWWKQKLRYEVRPGIMSRFLEDME